MVRRADDGKAKARLSSNHKDGDAMIWTFTIIECDFPRCGKRFSARSGSTQAPLEAIESGWKIETKTVKSGEVKTFYQCPDCSGALIDWQ